MQSNAFLTAGNDSLLPQDRDFVIRGTGSPYLAKANVTYRSPQERGSAQPVVVATSTLRADQLRNLRCVQIDGQFYVLNDADSGIDRELCFRVVNEHVGNAIIKAVIDYSNPNFAESHAFKDLGVPAFAQKLTRLSEVCGPLIAAACGLSIAGSALLWIFFK